MKAKCPRGFTLVEMMVSMLIFSLLLSGVLAFFFQQSHSMTESRAAKTVKEAVNSALRVVANDLLHAGAGIADPLSPTGGRFPELSLLVESVGGSQQLYVNWSGFLDYDAIPNFGEPANSVFSSRGYVDLGMPSSTFEMRLIPDSVKVSRDIGALIVNSNNSVTAESCNIEVSEKENGKQTLTFTILDKEKESDSSKEVEGQVSPAIVYKWAQDEESDSGGRLFRNGIPLLGGLVAGNKFQVTGFHVQCKFSDPLKGTEWSPRDGTTAGYQMKNLRLVRVTIDYTWKVPNRGMNTSSSTINVAPRSFVRSGEKDEK
jgi:prepilin-type N-terminal cleavage/methylation domain-containing protein